MKIIDVLLQRNIDQHHAWQIIKSSGMWTVLYDDELMHCRRVASWQAQTALVPKYFKTTFSTKGTAIAAAKKYNKMFNTDKFTVSEVNTIDRSTS